jgi:hypothetical protein
MRVHFGAGLRERVAPSRAETSRGELLSFFAMRIKRAILRIEAGTFLNPKSWGASTHPSEEKKNAYLPCDCGSRRDDDRRGHCATGQP